MTRGVNAIEFVFRFSFPLAQTAQTATSRRFRVAYSGAGLSKILCTRVPGRRLSIYPETP